MDVLCSVFDHFNVVVVFPLHFLHIFLLHKSAKIFNGDVSKWDVSAVEQIFTMFKKYVVFLCFVLTSLLLINLFDAF